MLRLRALGGLSIEDAERMLGGAATQRKPLALMALLAAAGPRGVSRDKLLACLWPETSAGKATHRLTQLIYALRRDLGIDDLFVGSTELRLRASALTTDIAEFTGALEGGDVARAVGVYGGPFLDGFYLSDTPTFERWAEEQRSALARRYVAALESLAHDAARRGDLVAAAGYWRQLSHAEPLNAHVAASYIRALGAAGDRVGALRYARSYAALLRAEFDIDPDPEVLAAVERARTDRVVADGSGQPRDASPGSSAAWHAPAIAVLPFTERGPEDETRYFSAGMTDELTAALARVPGLRVASRASTKAFTDCDLDIRQIADRLGVSAVVDGSVRKVGNRIRVSARVVSGTDGRELWSATYDRTLDQVFALQRALAHDVVGALPISTASPPEIEFSPPLTVTGAYPLLLRGRYAVRKRTVEGLALAIEYFEQVVEMDPTCGPAHVGLAECWALRGFAEFGDVESTVAMPRARAAALEAQRIDPRLADAHTALGMVHLLFDWEWAAAHDEFRRAVQLEPRNWFAQTWYAIYLAAAGRHDESIRRILYAETLEPLSLQLRLCVGRCYVLARRYREATEYLEALLAVEPGHTLVTVWLARSLCASGRHGDALDRLGRVPAALHTAYLRRMMVCALLGVGRAEEAREMLRLVQRDLAEGRVPRSSVMHLAAPSVVLGEHDAALDALEQAVRFRSGLLPFLMGEPELDCLRSRPRFRAVLAALRRPE